MKKRALCSTLLGLFCAQLVAQGENTSERLTESTSSLQSNVTVQPHPSIDKEHQDDSSCQFKISPETNEIDETFVLAWTTHAAMQSFHFTPDAIEHQLQQLQSCYTPKGWEELSKALYKSGNIDLIKTRAFTVNSEIDGPAQLIEAQGDLWKVTLPLRVIYQNDQERITHFLNVYFTIGRKLRGELGIMQMIAIPRATPSFQKAGSMKEIVQGIYSILAEKNTETHHNMQQKVILPFLASLLPNPTRVASSASEERERSNLMQYQPTNSVTSLQNLGREENLHKVYAENPMHSPNKPVPIVVQIDPKFFSSWANQAIAHTPSVKTNLIPIAMQAIRAWYAEKNSLAIQHMTPADAKQTQKLILSGLFGDSSGQSERDDKQWNITLPLDIAYQNDKGKITHLLNINFTFGWKINSHLDMAMLSKPTLFNSNRQEPPLTSSQQTQELLPTEIASLPGEFTNTPNTIDCNYKIPAEITNIEERLILNWAEKATIQSFDFNAEMIDNQLEKLQSCYTEKGWLEFKTALDKSGNIEAIKALHLNMTGRMNGQAQLIESRVNQWKLKLPLEVVWQNDKTRTTQLLNVDLTIGRKANGDLGIMQIIATLGGTASLKSGDYMTLSLHELGFRIS
ncbi:DotI/IcmL family type IV secretion protein [Legionella hackeliae]|uniref:Putative IcmL-like n=1 Tax=Legionella hackeliae TaxID=449 RepID=A0A0A8UWT3_LEGHA|nr:DotI/IcmL family type IV secretion protein [Legionella hackeliae]KTD13127.1 IcmL-like protein [Legionella hackeliae]CEK11562.1 putative IcmL-like [Legionella hackeliae]STX48333.1 IcmL-like protein [Legionella hackeliae]